MPRIHYTKIAPEGFRKLGEVTAYVAAAGLEEALLHLVYLRVSQINACPYCIDLHWREAVRLGQGERKLNGVALWRDMPFFNDQERAALEWAEAVTRVVDQEAMQAAFERAKTVFGDKELTDLTFGIAQMNAFNRVAVAFHAVPADPAKERK